MWNSIKNIKRLIGVARILARHNALFPLEYFGLTPFLVGLMRAISNRRAKGRDGERLARALNEAGPSFIKLGQMLSTRSDLLGDELAEDLSTLQDSLPAFSSAVAIATVEAELGQPLDQIFQSFDDQPQAAASIAQVHFAVTKNGQDVAVKILRPHIEQAFTEDLDLFRWMASLIEKAKPELRRLKPKQVVEKLADTVDMEMDLRLEAAAADELAENFSDDETFIVPTIDWSRTAERVLTSQRIYGLPIDDYQSIVEAGHDPKQVLQKASEASFNQIFRDGFFHADVHPGNLFVQENGAIGVVDFGIMGRIDLPTRRALGEMLIAFLSRNYHRVAEIHFQAGWVPAQQSLNDFAQACRSIAEPILDKPQNEISIAKLLGQLFKITATFQMETQPHLLLLQKTMLVAEGTGRKLHPEANMWLLARPLIENWMRNQLGPEAKIKQIADTAKQTLERLPVILDGLERTTQMMSDGYIKLHPDTIRALKKNPNDRPTLIWAITIAGLIGAALALVFTLL